MQRLRASAVRRTCTIALLVGVLAPAIDAQDRTDRQRFARLEDALKREGDALLRLADAAGAGDPVPADFRLSWRNDFFKAQPGTFVPFIVSFDASAFASRAALMFVRVQHLGDAGAPPSRGRGGRYPYETIFPVQVDPERGGTAVVTRGFAVAPGRYRVIVVLRESFPDPSAGADRPRKAAALIQDLAVPDFWTGELATSTVILADRLEPLSQPPPTAELDEDPYVVGAVRIHPALSSVYSKDRELIVVFLVYNPTVDAERHFDVQVDYHLYRKDPKGKASPGTGDYPPPRTGERYVTRTNPQRFNPSLMGRQFDPTGGAPVLAGQGILLSDMEPGDYRLLITVTDLLSRRTITRDVSFAVSGS